MPDMKQLEKTTKKEINYDVKKIVILPGGNSNTKMLHSGMKKVASLSEKLNDDKNNKVNCRILVHRNSMFKLR